jgi:mgtE-like transporter
VAQAGRRRNLLRDLGQSLLSLSFNLFGMFAGFLLSIFLGLFQSATWLLLIFPGILSIRGAIGGITSGRISTALHAGTVNTSLTHNTKEFYSLLSATVVLTFESGVLMSAVSFLFAAVLLAISLADAVAMLAVIISTLGASLFFVTPVSVMIAVTSFKKGLDPDVTVYPIVSTITDVFVTIFFVLLANSFLSLPLVRPLAGLFVLVFAFTAIYVAVRFRKSASFTRTIKEFIPTLLLTAFIVNVTGSTLQRISGTISGRREVYMTYPALIDTVGDVGSIVGSTLTTKLALGTIEPHLASIKRHTPEIGSAWGASAVMFLAYGAIASTVFAFFSPGVLVQLSLVLLVTNLLANSLVIGLSYTVAISTWKHGWDPDNFVIPLESCLADTITSVSLLLALLLVP